MRSLTLLWLILSYMTLSWGYWLQGDIFMRILTADIVQSHSCSIYVALNIKKVFSHIV